MATTPYAKLLVSIDGGAPQSGGIEDVTPEASCQLSYESTVGWPSQPAPYVEIYAYPDGWTPGAGWEEVAVAQPNGDTYTAYRFYGKVPPPAFTLPDIDHWDKILFQLVVNNGQKGGVSSADMVDDSTGISIYSADGLRGIAYREGRQFGGNLKWLRDLRHNFALIAASLFGVPASREIATTAPLRIDGGASADLSDDRTLSLTLHGDGGLVVTSNALQLGELGFARVAAALALASSTIDVNAQRIVDLADPVDPQDAATMAYVDSVGGGLDAETAVLENTDTAVNAGGVPIQNLPSQLVFLRSGGAPIKAVHRAASAGTATEGLRVSQAIAGGGGVGTGGESVSIALSLPNGSASDTVAASIRGQWTSVIGGGSSKIVLAPTLAGTPNDRLELSSTGVLTLNAYTSAGLLTNNGSGVLSSSNPAILVHGTVPANISNGLNTQALGGTAVLFQASAIEPIWASRTDASNDTVLDALAVMRVPDGGNGATGIGVGIAIRTMDDGAGGIDIGRLTWTTTNINPATATMGLSVAQAGSLPEVATLTGTGVWTTDGAMRTDAGFDRETAGTALFGTTVATAVTIGSVGITTTIAGNLVVSGTTTTVDSTTVAVADRLVVYNSSTGVVPVPTAIAGFVVDRGSADGVTKRDGVGLFWNETNSRFDFAFNTGLDQSTIGAFAAVKFKALTIADFSTGVLHSDSSGVLSSSLIVNADVNAAAAIAGTKISPDFGSQVVTTTGAVRGASFDREAAGALPIGLANATSITSYVGAALQHTLAAASLTWAQGLSNPTIGIDQRTGDNAATTLIIAGQTPSATATSTNRDAKGITLDLRTPTSGGAEGFLTVTSSGATIFRLGRPSGAFEEELRFYPAATVLRPNTISGSTVEIFAGGVVLSGNNANLRDVNQVRVGGFAMSSASLSLLADGATTSWSIGHTQRSGTGSNAGTALSIAAQQGQNVAAGTNNNGGDLNLASGAPGTGGTGGSNGVVAIKTGSTTRIEVASDGSITTSHGASATSRRQYGTAGTRYTDYVSAVFTSNSSAGYETALSYTLPDNCIAEVIVWGTAINVSTGDAAGYGKRRTVKRFSGGGATAVGSERDLGADNEDVVAYQLRTNVTGNTVYVEVDSDTAAAKWGIDVEVRITTTSA